MLLRGHTGLYMPVYGPPPANRNRFGFLEPIGSKCGTCGDNAFHSSMFFRLEISMISNSSGPSASLAEGGSSPPLLAPTYQFILREEAGAVNKSLFLVSRSPSCILAHKP